MSDDMLPKDVTLPSIHTMQSDAAEAVEHGNISKVDILAAKIKEQEKDESLTEKLKIPVPTQANVFINKTINNDVPLTDTNSKSSHVIRNIFITFFLIVLLGAGGVGIFLFTKSRTQLPPVSTAPAIQDQELIPFDTTKTISISTSDLTNSELLTADLVQNIQPSASGTTFFKTSVTMKQILATLSPSIPDQLVRSLDTKEFFGTVSSGQFIILKVDSYDYAYAGMLSWETTMNQDLLPLFSDSPASTLSHFEDRIVTNKDARAALDQNGNTLFIYGFYDNNTLVFAKNENTFSQVQQILLRQNL